MADNHGELGFKPPHPGDYLKEDVLPELGISISEFARHIGVTRQTASKLVNGRIGISLEMAIRLGKAFKNGARFWAALQMQYDLWEEQKNFSDNVMPINPNDEQAA